MTPTEVGIAVNIAINLGALGYAFGSLGAKVKRNVDDIQGLFRNREMDREALNKSLGAVEGKQGQAHGRLRETLDKHETRITRMEAKANGAKA